MIQNLGSKILIQNFGIQIIKLKSTKWSGFTLTLLELYDSNGEPHRLDDNDLL